MALPVSKPFVLWAHFPLMLSSGKAAKWTSERAGRPSGQEPGGWWEWTEKSLFFKNEEDMRQNVLA